ncbi:lymphoid-specific helicase-like [Ylistrum balloti]|uniref:lymphoid-specific helicase-like n=1 Tax=Ylistrum balloti TaxID=509963 RepID=UPI002905ED3E|nr:lymphoid-specific helicase-like [Ylistrum balloti]
MSDTAKEATPDTETTEKRSKSPVLPKDEAHEPGEDAHQNLAITASSVEDANISAKQELDEEESSMAMDEGDGDVIKKDQSLVTKQMIAEEEQLNKEGEEEDKKQRDEHAKLWEDLDSEIKEQRYKRLQFLLSKSNMYTQYLLERMKKQSEEEKRKNELREKRRVKAEEKKKKALEEQEKAKSQEIAKEEDTVTQSLSSPLKSSIPQHSGYSPQAADIAPSPRSTRTRTSKKTQSSQSSQGSQNSSTSETETTGKKRGRKRKVEAVEGANISKFFNPMEKKPKKDDEKSDSAEKSNTTEKCKTLQSSKGDPLLDKTPLEEKTEEDMKVNEVNSETKLVEDDDETEEYDTSMPFVQPKLFSGGTLRQYQSEGFTWLKTLYENGVNGILGDEMGLGKTIQCIAMLAHLVSMGVPGPFIVCAPLSTLPNWYAEFKRFAPKVPVILYHGHKDERTRLRMKMYKKYSVKKDVEVQPVVITSYEITIIDRKLLSSFEWKYLIVDEGHRIKNTHCRLIRELRLYRNTHRLLLTGTPLQNNLSELWSLLNFLLPEIFDDLGSFEAWFDVDRLTASNADEEIVKEEQKMNILSMLHQILTPFMLRRLKQDVELNIPPKKEIMVFAPLTKIQEEFYSSLIDRTILQRVKSTKKPEEKVEVNEKGRPVRRTTKKKVNYQLMMAEEADRAELKKTQKGIDDDEEHLASWIAAINEETKKSTLTPARDVATPTSQVTIKLLNVVMQLRKCCNHPYLLEYPLDPGTGNFKVDEDVIRKSGKMLLLDRMLKELKVRGHKVLIFSQFTTMLDILEDFCFLRSYKFCRLDGSCNVQTRQESMTSFNTDPEMFLFLLSTRAGGLGINLVAADTVIIYDSDWNPQCDLQAQDRCHRIGQTKPICVYRFITANTVDQRIVERAAAKRKIEKMVIHKEKFKSGIRNFTTSLQPLTQLELMDLLKSNDHQLAVNSGGTSSVISKRDLERLLDRSDLYEQWKASGNKDDGSFVKKSKKTLREVKGVFKVMDEDDVNDEMDDDSKATS